MEKILMNASLGHVPAAAGSGLIRLMIAAALAGLLVASCESSGEPDTSKYDNDSHGRSYSDPHHGSSGHCGHCKH